MVYMTDIPQCYFHNRCLTSSVHIILYLKIIVSEWVGGQVREPLRTCDYFQKANLTNDAAMEALFTPCYIYFRSRFLLCPNILRRSLP